ncbi:hypothetical protein ACTL32_14565 [Planococcus sp. FY231025]|uniref:hypothetical protein n=1 Tax=Planococcus sp. FY231025 TaxID=3455699 RepID=UPI003F9347FD
MNNLYEGTITNQALSKKEPLNMKRLYLEDLPEIEKIQQHVIDSLPDKGTLQPLSTEEFLFILNERGLLVGAYAEDRLIGFRALLVPEIDAEHLGYDLGLPEEDLPHVIYQEISVVLPEYRGNRLQQKLADVIMKELPNLEGRFRYVCCTVAPLNIPSLKDKFSQGMHIGALKEKYDGMLRYILVKDLQDAAPEYTGYTSAKIDDLEKQQELLADGFVGIGILIAKGFHELQFAKPVH